MKRLIFPVLFLSCVNFQVSAAPANEILEKANLAPIHLLPLWLNYILTVLLVMASIYAGYKYSSHKQNNLKEEHGPIGSVVSAMLGLLAFIMAFTFGVTSNRLDTRKQLVLDEATAIHTLYLRTRLLPEPIRNDTRLLVKEYAQLRKELLEHPDNLSTYLQMSNDIHRKLWDKADLLSKTPMLHSDVLSLYTEALDRVIQLQSERVTVLMVHHLPSVIWLVLYLLTVLSMAGLGYQFGLDQKPNPALFWILSLGFSAVLMLIVDLDGFSISKNSLIHVSQQPLYELLERMQD